MRRNLPDGNLIRRREKRTREYRIFVRRRELRTSISSRCSTTDNRFYSAQAPRHVEQIVGYFYKKIFIAHASFKFDKIFRPSAFPKGAKNFCVKRRTTRLHFRLYRLSLPAYRTVANHIRIFNKRGGIQRFVRNLLYHFCRRRLRATASRTADANENRKY